MSSSIYNDQTAWNVSNMMFSRVLDFAGEVGGERGTTELERRWVVDLAEKVAAFATYSPDVHVRDLFAELSQIEFWRVVLNETAKRIYNRQLGSQSDQTWQVPTIWATVDLARLLDSSAQLMRQTNVADKGR